MMVFKGTRRAAKASVEKNQNPRTDIATRLDHLSLAQDSLTTEQTLPHTGNAATVLTHPIASTQNRRTRRCIVAIDYGTTFSSVAYIIVLQENASLDSVKPFAIRGYPSSNTGRNSDDDVPTVSLYNDRADKKFWWGYEVAEVLGSPRRLVSAGTPTIRLVKLLLSHEHHLEDRQGPLQEILDQCGITKTQAIADFLGKLWENAMQEIRHIEGSSRFEGFQKDLVLSVPPAWNAPAVRIMQKAASMAGIPQPQIVTEPEAAALIVLNEKGLSNENFKIDDVFLVVDAGGGTVDLAAYRLVKKKPFRVSEVSDPIGASYGSSLLNLSFQKWFRKHLFAEKAKYSEHTEQNLEKMVNAATDAFEFKKRTFTGDETHGPDLEVGGLKESRNEVFEEGFVCIPKAVMLQWFDDLVCGKIIPLVKKCICDVHETTEKPWNESLIKHIVIVGGFSASKYLQRQMEASFETISADDGSSYPIEVLYSQENHETVVARGSVLRSLEPNFLTHRRLRTSYGVKGDEVFKNGVHDANFKQHDEHEPGYVVRDCIRWIYKAGQLLAQDKKFEDVDLHWTVDADHDFGSQESQDEFVCELYMSDDPDPQDHQTLLQMKKEDKHIERCYKLVADLTNADTTSLRKRSSKKGKEYLRIDYMLRPSVLGVETEWELMVNLPGARTKKHQMNIASAFKPGEAGS